MTEVPEWVKTAKVGDKVVAIGGGAKRAIPRKFAVTIGATLPERGKVYTIRQINEWHDAILILLDEINNEHMISVIGGDIEPGFSILSFRPVQPRKTDISCFTSLLNTTPADLVEA